jgi:aspartyl-tRNA(Asn)/glutamyl-tRNA(Gln) amidotransferase subunit C
MATITPKDMAHIAELARLGLTPQACEDYAAQCSQILAFVDQLQEADTSAVAPMAQAGAQGTVWREDAPVPSQQADAIVENAPATSDRFITVPRVIT